jgi:tetratricopeptide (TPR) repeat protein
MAQILHVGGGSGEKRANVIFLHGLGGDPRSTWQHGPDEDLFWPRWLAEDVPGLSVYSIGYEASVSRWRGTAMHLADRAANVLARILAEPQLQSGQLILIGHSLGGLVIKQLLQNAESEGRHNAEAANFLERVDKVAFLATPHTGANLAAISNRMRILVQPSAATASLVRNDPNLRRLNSWYRTWANARGISHLTLTETDAISILGMIVEPDSGDAGLAGSNPVPIDSNHWTICKPNDRTHDTYVFVRKFIETRIERPKTAAEEGLAALNSKVDRLVSALAERGETAGAEQAGVSPEAIIRLAQRINTDIDDFDQALLELERAVGVAIEVAEEGRRGSNSGDLVDEVLKRIADKSAEGRFDEAAAEADKAFLEWEREETERRAATVVGGLKLLEAGLKQDILRRDAASAAKRIERVAALEYPHDRSTRFEAMRKLQDAWYTRGRDRGLNLDLQISIEAARLLVASADNPNETGNALTDLGTALWSLGERESGTARLEEAVETYRAALQEYDPAKKPLEWAMTHSNLGTTLRSLGEREAGTARLQQAVDAFRATLENVTRETFPYEWALTQNNLGNALRTLGERESDTVQFERAVEAYEAALQERTRERTPHEWAMTQNNLGNALATLGDHTGDKARLEAAVAAYRAALEEHTRAHFPLDWAATQNNLGNVLTTLGKHESDRIRFEEAVEAYSAALQERTRERMPFQWAATQHNLGNALEALGESDSGTTSIEEAIKAYLAALEERPRERVPHLYDQSQRNLQRALETLEQRKNEAVS